MPILVHFTFVHKLTSCGIKGAPKSSFGVIVESAQTPLSGPGVQILLVAIWPERKLKVVV